MYAGHTTEDGRIQPLLEHLQGVGDLAGAYADRFGCAELGRLLGLCHDLGKYSERVQNRLLRGGPKADHATAGGQEIVNLLGKGAAPFAYPVLGHHGGLPDGGSPVDAVGIATLYSRLKKPLQGGDDYRAFREEITLEQPPNPPLRPLGECGFSMSLLIRMLFSCLVDADFLDTERFMSAGAVERGDYEDIPTLWARLERRLERFRNPKTDLNRKRCEIQADCLAAAEGEKGLYSLTVPTGGGKTVASLAFALRHAAKHGMDRVIYVIPYTSIIEQNAGVFAEILGRENVLEHHSSTDFDNPENGADTVAARHYLSTENWDAPVVVTTNVQFFESLFAARPSRCRKLHSIANSVVIFDEAQMIPLDYLLPCVRAIAELVYNFGSTAVICSATQPALAALLPKEIPMREMMRDPQELYRFFRRTVIERAGPLEDDALAERMNAQEQVLCITSTRLQAQNIFQKLEGEGCFHLSTLMYPEHRRQALKTIRERLTNGLPCRVVATSLIEAGVDVDFPQVYRAETGLDSIIQAAGRCNRENKRPAEASRVFVYKPAGGYRAPTSQAQLISVYNEVAAVHEDLASLDAIRDYFERLYDLRREALDRKNILQRLEKGWSNGGSFPFATIAGEFSLIETQTYPILIPIEPEAATLAARLRAGERGRGLLRQIGHYSVNVYENHYKALYELGLIEPLEQDGGLNVLTDPDSYRPETGLSLTPETGKALFVDG